MNLFNHTKLSFEKVFLFWIGSVLSILLFFILVLVYKNLYNISLLWNNGKIELYSVIILYLINLILWFLLPLRLGKIPFSFLNEAIASIGLLVLFLSCPLILLFLSLPTGMPALSIFSGLIVILFFFSSGLFIFDIALINHFKVWKYVFSSSGYFFAILLIISILFSYYLIFAIVNHVYNTGYSDVNEKSPPQITYIFYSFLSIIAVLLSSYLTFSLLLLRVDNPESRARLFSKWLGIIE